MGRTENCKANGSFHKFREFPGLGIGAAICMKCHLVAKERGGKTAYWYHDPVNFRARKLNANKGMG